MSARPTRVGPVVAAGARQLAASGVASPEHDARALLAHVLGGDRNQLVRVRELESGELACYEGLVARRAAREPLQYITGRAPFRHLEIAVGPGVFVPRPETEGLVDLVLPAAVPGAVVVDLCAGSGAIALSLATECPGVRVHAVEPDHAALGWLYRNLAGNPITIHALAARDIVGAQSELVGRVDVVVSNPPYLPTGLALDPEVAGHDPSAALWAGPDGLDVLRDVALAATQLLRPAGLVAVEHDESQRRAVIGLLRAAGFAGVAGHRDLAGRDRYVTAVKISA